MDKLQKSNSQICLPVTTFVMGLLVFCFVFKFLLYRNASRGQIARGKRCALCVSGKGQWITTSSL